MLNFKWPFVRADVTKVVTASSPDGIRPGDQFILKETSGDPFPQKNQPLRTVLEVRDGWVRYKVGAGHIFDDERMELDLFLRIYRRVS